MGNFISTATLPMSAEIIGNPATGRETQPRTMQRSQKEQNEIYRGWKTPGIWGKFSVFKGFYRFLGLLAVGPQRIRLT